MFHFHPVASGASGLIRDLKTVCLMVLPGTGRSVPPRKTDLKLVTNIHFGRSKRVICLSQSTTSALEEETIATRQVQWEYETVVSKTQIKQDSLFIIMIGIQATNRGKSFTHASLTWYGYPFQHLRTSVTGSLLTMLLKHH